MIRVAALALLALALPGHADPIVFTEKVRAEGREYRIPMLLDLTALSQTTVGVRLTGDLWAIQRDLPGLLSEHIEQTCERRLSLAVTEARAEGEAIRLRGQLQAEVNTCREVDGVEEQLPVLKQTATVDTLLGGELVNGCLVMRVIETNVRPDGFTGALMNATGYTARINRDLERQLDRALTEGDNCIELPSEFRAFDTVITGGGFRDIGEGRIGAVIEGRMEIDARNFIRLIHTLGVEGKIGD